MSYYLTNTVKMPFADAVAFTRKALQRRDWRVLTEIDMRANFKEALGVDFRPYLILGVCNPQLTYRALKAEDKIGTMLPCNIVLQEHEDGRVEISAVDPIASMQAIPNVEVGQIAEDARSALQRVLDDIETAPRPDNDDRSLARGASS